MQALSLNRPRWATVPPRIHHTAFLVVSVGYCAGISVICAHGVTQSFFPASDYHVLLVVLFTPLIAVGSVSGLLFIGWYIDTIGRPRFTLPPEPLPPKTARPRAGFFW